jgi:hypothetical protein
MRYNCPFHFIDEFDDWWYWHVCVIYWKTSESWATIVVSNKDEWKPVGNPSSGGLVRITKSLNHKVL